MKVRFWGVRGNVVMPGPYTIKYGGNTPCIEIRGDDNELLIIDAGTGLRELGLYLTQNDFQQGPIDAKILLTHTHWDHMQGFPFFAPVIFIPQNKITFYGPVDEDDSLEDVIGGQMNYSYFPVKLDELKAMIKFRNLVPGEFNIGEFKIKSRYLNHQVLTFSYKIEYRGKVITTVFDHEPYGFERYIDGTLSDIEKDKIKENAVIKKDELIDFISGSDLIIHDAMYTRDDYFEKKVGWGHSYFEYAVENAVASKTKMLALFHHEYEDEKMDKCEKSAKNYAKSLDNNLVVFAAREKLEITI